MADYASTINMVSGSNINLNKNELRNARIQNLATAPSSPVEGQIYHNTADHITYIYNGSSWIPLKVSYGDTTPQTETVGDLGQAGTSTEVSRKDHRHPMPGAATTGAAGFMSAADKTKLDGIAAGAEVNQNTFSNITDGTNTAAAETKTDTFKLRSANNILSVAVTNDDATHGDNALFTLNQGNIDHGSIAGLTDDDHTQYSRVDGSRSFTQPVGGVTPTQGSHLTTRDYVDQKVDASRQGMDPKDSVRVAVKSNVNITAPGATVDGVTMALNNRVALMGQSTGSQNGIWLWKGASTPMVRSADADADADVTCGMYFYVEEGTYTGESYILQTNDPITVGTTSLTFVVYNKLTSYTAGDGLDLTGSTFSAKVDGTTLEINNDALRVKDGGIGDAKIASGVTRTKLANGSANHVLINNGSGVISSEAQLALSRGGTGSGTAAGARANLGAPGKYVSGNLGNSSLTSFTVNHNLNTQDVGVFLRYTASPYALFSADYECTDANNVTVKFDMAPATNSFVVIVIG